MRITLLLCISIVLMCSCSRIKSKYESVKERIKEEINSPFRTDFYSDPGAWDYYRVPLIAPYELCSTLLGDDGKVWDCTRRNNKDEFGGFTLATARHSVESVGLQDSIIYLYYTEQLTPLDLMPSHKYDGWEMRRFVIIDVPTDSVEWHETREEWLTALNKRGIVQPQLHHVDSLYDDFANNNRLLFNPSK
jgi:lipoprotein